MEVVRWRSHGPTGHMQAVGADNTDCQGLLCQHSGVSFQDMALTVWQNLHDQLNAERFEFLIMDGSVCYVGATQP